MGNLANLWYLNLGGAFLSGEIPPELGNLASLRALNLHSNDLNGGIPAELGSLSNLYNATGGANWEDSENWLSDFPLGGWEGVTTNNGRVTKLDLGHNDLSGEIPAELGSLSNLKRLVLSGIYSSEEIPAWLGSLSNLIELDLSYIGLSGEIPAELGSLSNLTYLNLGNNDLSGCVPSSLEGQVAPSDDLPFC